MTGVKTVDVYTCREILRIRAGVEQYAPPDGFGEYYWTELLRGCAEADALEATWEHYRTRTRPLMPADILIWVRARHAARLTTVTGITEKLRRERTGLDWSDDKLTRWQKTFETEIGLGADIDDARDTADLDAHEYSGNAAAAPSHPPGPPDPSRDMNLCRS
ncbi:hypothetical protein [Nocardia carnea]|uniref:Uncharacterized protein n=1 Tax=Nocardia carnea TaxID=37328 RepID=A0ABW7TN71_9NOCA|nr:hypothetical protein [Nocardia carnea]